MSLKMTNPVIELTVENGGICNWYTTCIGQDRIGTLGVHYSKELAIGETLRQAQRHGYKLPEELGSNPNTFNIGHEALSGRLPGVSIVEMEKAKRK